MKTQNFKLPTLNLRWAITPLALITYALSSSNSTAQIQQAWVARYNNGITNGTNQAVKMTLDISGNIYVTGFSQNSASNLGYVTIKYAPNGNQLWAARLDSTNYLAAAPTGLVLDNSNDVVVTGNALTVKYDPNGRQLWTAPYGGSAIAMDAAGNSVVTGFASGYNTVKISPTGTNLWLVTYNEPLGPVQSQVVLVDNSSSVYVAGTDTYVSEHGLSYEQLLIVKYDRNGNQLWTAANSQGGGMFATVHVEGAALDGSNSIYLLTDFYPDTDLRFITFKYTTSGSEVWVAFNPTDNGGSVAYGLGLDAADNTFVTGADAHYYPNTPYPIGTYKIGTNGAYVWTNLYYSIPVASSVGTSIAVDQANSVYVTGYSPGTNSRNDIVTIKYGNNGNQIWLQRYNGPGNGDDAGNAIAVDRNGNVYVTGYETTAAGGTEIVTIKYSPVTLQRRTDGTVLLQAQGSPGESFDFQGSTDLMNWLDLGSMVADSNGVAQFADTNASNYNQRFYVTSPQ